MREDKAAGDFKGGVPGAPARLYEVNQTGLHTAHRDTTVSRSRQTAGRAGAPVWQERAVRDGRTSRRVHRAGELKVAAAGSGPDRRVVYVSVDAPHVHGPRAVMEPEDAQWIQKRDPLLSPQRRAPIGTASVSPARRGRR